MQRKSWMIAMGWMLVLIPLSACSFPQINPGNNSATTPVVATQELAPTRDDILRVTVPAETETPTSAPVQARIAIANTQRNLLLWTQEGNDASQLTQTQDAVNPYLSPDGSLIVFTSSKEKRNGTFQIDVIQSDGQNRRTLVSPADLNKLSTHPDSANILPDQIVWIPNSHKFLLTLYYENSAGSIEVDDALYQIDADGGQVSQILPAAASGKLFLSPDGSRFAVVKYESVNLFNIDGSLISLKAIQYPDIRTSTGLAFYPDLTWKKDGSSFIIAVPTSPASADHVNSTAIYLADNTGRVLQTYNTLARFIDPGSIGFNAAFNKMAYFLPNGNSADLHLANLDGSSDTIIDNGLFFQTPLWSDQGNFFVYSKYVDQGFQAFLGNDTNAPVAINNITSLDTFQWLGQDRYVASNRLMTEMDIYLGNARENSVSQIFADTGPIQSQILYFSAVQ